MNSRFIPLFLINPQHPKNYFRLHHPHHQPSPSSHRNWNKNVEVGSRSVSTTLRVQDLISQNSQRRRYSGTRIWSRGLPIRPRPNKGPKSRIGTHDRGLWMDSSWTKSRWNFDVLYYRWFRSCRHVSDNSFESQVLTENRPVIDGVVRLMCLHSLRVVYGILRRRNTVHGLLQT